MKIVYDNATDSMYIHFSDQVACDSSEAANGVVLDLNEDGEVVGIDIQHASKIADVNKLVFEQSNLKAA